MGRYLNSHLVYGITDNEAGPDDTEKIDDYINMCENAYEQDWQELIEEGSIPAIMVQWYKAEEADETGETSIYGQFQEFMRNHGCAYYSFGVGDYTKYFIGIEASAIEGGRPVLVEQEKFEVRPEWKLNLEKVAAKLELPNNYARPGWYLSAYYA